MSHCMKVWIFKDDDLSMLHVVHNFIYNAHLLLIIPTQKVTRDDRHIQPNNRNPEQ